MKAELLYPSGCILGESPMWDSRRMTCCWVDIEGRKVYEMNWRSRCVTTLQVQERVSLVVPGRGDYLIAAVEGGICRLDMDVISSRFISDLGINWDNLRCNDGGCDSHGRLWVGTTGLQHRHGAGAVYSISENDITKCLDALTIPNGIAWSPDNERLYFTDSTTRRVSSFKYKAESGEIDYEREVITIPEEAGLPDGMAMDKEGMIWIALWGGYGVGRFNVETGAMIDFIDVPAPHTTSCCFAGPDLEQLVITTAKKGLTAKELDVYPNSGNIFIASPGVCGMPRYRCGL